MVTGCGAGESVRELQDRNRREIEKKILYKKHDPVFLAGFTGLSVKQNVTVYAVRVCLELFSALTVM